MRAADDAEDARLVGSKRDAMGSPGAELQVTHARRSAKFDWPLSPRRQKQLKLDLASDRSSFSQVTRQGDK